MCVYVCVHTHAHTQVCIHVQLFWPVYFYVWVYVVVFVDGAACVRVHAQFGSFNNGLWEKPVPLGHLSSPHLLLFDATLTGIAFLISLLNWTSLILHQKERTLHAPFTQICASTLYVRSRVCTHCWKSSPSMVDSLAHNRQEDVCIIS